VLDDSHQFAGADFDGRRLAWGEFGCAGEVMRYTADVSTLSPASAGQVPPRRCPVRFHLSGALHPNARGIVRVAVSCPAGCLDVSLEIAAPAQLATEASSYFSLPASPATVIRPLRIAPRQLAYVRRRRRVRILLRAFALGYGPTQATQSSARAVLSR